MQKLCQEVIISCKNAAGSPEDEGTTLFGSGYRRCNFLVVSHGGFIRELIGHLYEDHDCKGIPEKNWKVVTPNTGISKFELEFDLTAGRLVDVVCTLFKHKDHLGSKFGDDGTALFDDRTTATNPPKGNNNAAS